ncbi:hypothetical protein Tco_0994029, partial [Tanacetum coccineum]
MCRQPLPPTLSPSSANLMIMALEEYEVPPTENMLVNDAWVSLWPSAKLMTGEKEESDHLALIWGPERCDWGPRPFRFNNSWFRSDIFSIMVLHLASFSSTSTSPFPIPYLAKPPPTWGASSFQLTGWLQHSVFKIVFISFQCRPDIHHFHLCWIYALAIKSSQRQAFVPSIDDKDSRSSTEDDCGCFCVDAAVCLTQALYVHAHILIESYISMAEHFTGDATSTDLIGLPSRCDVNARDSSSWRLDINQFQLPESASLPIP